MRVEPKNMDDSTFSCQFTSKHFFRSTTLLRRMLRNLWKGGHTRQGLPDTEMYQRFENAHTYVREQPKNLCIPGDGPRSNAVPCRLHKLRDVQHLRLVSLDDGAVHHTRSPCCVLWWLWCSVHEPAEPNTGITRGTPLQCLYRYYTGLKAAPAYCTGHSTL